MVFPTLLGPETPKAPGRSDSTRRSIPENRSCHCRISAAAPAATRRHHPDGEWMPPVWALECLAEAHRYTYL